MKAGSFWSVHNDGGGDLSHDPLIPVQGGGHLPLITPPYYHISDGASDATPWPPDVARIAGNEMRSIISGEASVLGSLVCERRDEVRGDSL